MPSIDIIIPVFNEAENVRPLIERIARAFHANKLSYQIIAVDDRSTDKTYAALKKLARTYPILVLKKQGHPGKAYSILEGARSATSDLICMIDGDLQYPPEVIPAMIAQTTTHGVVVAHRKTYEGSLLRRLGSRALRFVFGKLLLGIDTDMQSGLKVFKRSLLQSITENDVTPWALDLPLLHMAIERGFTIGEVDITFEKRRAGSSKLSLMGPTLAIATGAIKLKFSTVKPQIIHPQAGKHMIGAGVITKKQQFITHTTLDNKKSALTTFTAWQKRVIIGLLLLIGINLLLSPLHTGIVVVGILSFVYFVDVIFNFYLILKSLHSPPELSATPKELGELKDKDLPMYSILCPLYKEAHVLPHFLDAIAKLDWPKAKLDVILLFEADDLESIEAAKHMQLPKYVRVVVVPDSQPKTKPKACNYGLNLAKGEYLVIFDAEDQPEASQLKKAYLGFLQVGPNVKCLQAKLNYYNPRQNWLTRFFTAEYSLWFDVILTGLQSIQTTIPLGGTSNHFRTKDLLELEGWDPFNVTEDCDLGIRLFKAGYRTAIIDSTTLEEANSNFKNWLRQRSRWIKGYMQTYLIHMRDPKEFMEMQGIHALIFQLTVGGKLAFILINPILWVLTIAYFVLYRLVGPTIESLYPSIVFYMAATSLVFGNFMYIYYYMIGCAKREHWSLIKWIFFIPLYWLMVSIAGIIALYQLIVKPHYWEKTIHGLHLKKAAAVVAADFAAEAITIQQPHSSPLFSLSARKNARIKKLQKLFASWSPKKIFSYLLHHKYRDGFLYVIAAMTANILNLVTNVYLGRELSLHDFAIMNTFMSLLYLIGIPIGALSTTINIKTAEILGKHELTSAKTFWHHVRIRSIFLGIIASGIWIMSIPFLTPFLGLPTIFPLLAFTPLIAVSIINAADSGYLKGRLLFGVLALAVVIDPLTRLIFSYALGEASLHSYIYLAIPLSTTIAAIVTYLAARGGVLGPSEQRKFRLPVSFFSQALVSRISSIAFFSLDNLMVAHFLSQTDTGRYGVLGLVGKMIFFAGSLTLSFILPMVSYREGRGENSDDTFKKLFLLTIVITALAQIGLGIVLPIVAPFILGGKFTSIREFLPIYGTGILLYTISQAIVQYHLAKKEYDFSILSFLIAIIQVSGLLLFHNSLRSVVLVMAASGVLNASLILLLHVYYEKIKAPLKNIGDLLGLFSKIPQFHRKKKTNADGKIQRILIFNWRDTKHVWAGGAEKYVHEIAKGLVDSGQSVTLFCGNDGKHARNETIDGVQIIRRGGFYTVYVWAFLYYIFRLRSRFDLVIDCENGIPFLTPLYVKVPIYLLIFHVHQDVFREHLHFPFSEIAAFIESDGMSKLYKQHEIITISESSRRGIIDLGLGNKSSIMVVNPGIESKIFHKKIKTRIPSLVYVGRLKAYKNVDIALHAFAKVVKHFPKATFTIAGTGESLHSLQHLTKKLHLEKNVVFTNEITDEQKANLLARSWVALQPSMVEGWGITVIEANACGTPVIASNTQGLRDSILNNETGILVEPKNVTELTQAIEHLLNDRELRLQLSTNALEWSKKFTWVHSSQLFQEFIHRTVKKQNGADPKIISLSGVYEK